MAALGAADSAAIRVIRVVCIFLMMSVHLVPGPARVSFVTQGAGSLIGAVWLDVLGRASVATLSLISGFLLVGALEKHGFPRIVRDRGRALLVPMMTWNVVGLLAILAAALAGGPAAGLVLAGLATPLGLLNGLTGLSGPTVNLSLFFLRDLFAATVLLALLWPLLRNRPGPALAVTLALTVFEVTAPVIFRPTILLFMLAGCALRVRHVALGDLAAPRRALPGLLAAGLVFCLCLLGDGSALAALQNVAKRVMLFFAVLGLAVALGRHPRIQAFFDRIAPVAFLAYLSHALLVKLLWAGAGAAGITLTGPSYLIYFFGAPVLVFALAFLAGPAIAALPDPLPALIRGRGGAEAGKAVATAEDQSRPPGRRAGRGQGRDAQSR